ncbi:MAG: CapA family protein [Halobacteria archaeon]
MAYHLGFTGDVMLGRLVGERQRRRSADAIWGDVLMALRDLDGLFVNLECCISRRGDPWTRTYRPFHFRAHPEWAVTGLGEAGVDYCSLANNHILDFGETALNDTVDQLKSAGIRHAGAGSLPDARKPVSVSVGDLEFAVFSATDNTPEYAASKDKPGAFYDDMDLDDGTREVFREVLDAAEELNPDLTVASLHWGPNMVEEPSRKHERFGRWLVDQGVDLVHGHSAHVFQAVEMYGDGLIMYDCGEFVDDYKVDPELRNDRSFLFKLKVTEGGDLQELSLTPVEIDKFTVNQADSQAKEWSFERMCGLSRKYGTEFERKDGELQLELT